MSIADSVARSDASQSATRRQPQFREFGYEMQRYGTGRGTGYTPTRGGLRELRIIQRHNNLSRPP